MIVDDTGLWSPRHAAEQLPTVATVQHLIHLGTDSLSSVLWNYIYSSNFYLIQAKSFQNSSIDRQQFIAWAKCKSSWIINFSFAKLFC